MRAHLITLLGLWLLCQTPVTAQFLGGTGGGAVNYRGPALPCLSLSLFNGGAGGGASDSPGPSLPCNNLGMFNGGVGSGHSDTLVRSSLDCGLFGSSSGGRGSGYAAAQPDVSPLDCGFFTGSTGSGDGSAVPAVSPLDCNLFAGSEGSGHSTAVPPVSPLDCKLFAGSRGSGHDNIEIEDAIDMSGADLVWIGEKDRNWFDADNWSGCDLLPSCARNVVIAPALHTPFINAPNAACHNITIRGGALLEIATTYNLDVCGHWVNEGQLIADVNSSVTLVGTADQRVAGDCEGPNAFSELIVYKATGKVRLEDSVQVMDTLWLRGGLVVTEAYVLSLLADGPAALKPGYGPNSYVQGNLRRYLQPTGEYAFPVGDTLMGYELARTDFVEATSIEHLTARFDRFAALPSFTSTDPECGNNGYDEELLNNGYWTVNAFPLAQANTGRYHIHLHNVGYTNEKAAFTVVRRPTGTAGLGGWALNGDCDATSVASLVSRQGMQGFSEFATAQTDVPFPLDKLQLVASPEPDYIRLNWLSEVETPTGRFELLRGESPDALRLLTTLNLETQAQEMVFTHNDFQVQRGVGYYYQVLRMDADGGGRLSNIAHAILPKVQRFAYNVYPNPANTEVHISLSASGSEQVTIRVTNQLGQRLYDDRVWVNEVQSRQTIRIADWAVGVYYITLSNDKELDTIKLVKLSR
ncbi:MAG: T9SS type A sorting domain-containing protein [Bacteroidetes bacterium]|nr:T9SS type A sorting domain-containing protein [Bacteroidota bacterium]